MQDETENKKVPDGHAEHLPPFFQFLGRTGGISSFSKRDALVLFGLFTILVMLQYVSVLGGGAVLAKHWSDIQTEWWWKRGYLGEALARGRIPFWNPFIDSGIPFLATFQSAVFYPFNWLFAIFPRVYVLNGQMIFHVWLALAAMFVLLRFAGRSCLSATAGSLVFAFTGFLILHLWGGHLVFVVEWPYLPLVLLFQFQLLSRAALRDRLLPFLGMTASLAMQIFGGHPQITFYTLLVAGGFQTAYLLWALRKGVWRSTIWPSVQVAASLGFSGVLTLIQTLPVLHYVKETPRAAMAGKDYFEDYAIHPADLPSLFSPHAWGGPVKSGEAMYIGAAIWEVSPYITAFAVVAYLFAAMFWKRMPGAVIAAVAMGAVSILLALGPNTGLFWLACQYIPGFSLFRMPGRFAAVYTTTGAFIVAYVMDYIVTIPRSQLRAVLYKFSAVFTLLLAASITTMWFSMLKDAPGGYMEDFIRGRISVFPRSPRSPELVAAASTRFVREVGLGIAAMVGYLALLWISASKKRAAITRPAIFVLLLAEVVYFSWPYRTVNYPDFWIWPPKIANTIKDSKPEYRIGSMAFPTDLCQGMDWGIRHVWGFEINVPARYDAALMTSEGYPALIAPQNASFKAITPLTNSLGLRYLLKHIDLREEVKGWDLVTSDSLWEIYRNPQALPRYRTVPVAHPVTEEIVASYVSSPRFDPITQVLVEASRAEFTVLAPFSDRNTSASPGIVTLVEDEPEYFCANVEMKQPGWFVLMDQMLPGWFAKVDGQPAKIYRANAVGRALPLPAGRHKLEMSYEAPGFRTGAWISGLGWTVWLLLFLTGFIFRKRRFTEK
jgi:hypothetical protein